jgi:hypothetical protein
LFNAPGPAGLLQSDRPGSFAFLSVLGILGLKGNSPDFPLDPSFNRKNQCLPLWHIQNDDCWYTYQQH